MPSRYRSRSLSWSGPISTARPSPTSTRSVTVAPDSMGRIIAPTEGPSFHPTNAPAGKSNRGPGRELSARGGRGWLHAPRRGRRRARLGQRVRRGRLRVAVDDEGRGRPRRRVDRGGPPPLGERRADGALLLP